VLIESIQSNVSVMNLRFITWHQWQRQTDRQTYPASWASCALIIESRLFCWRKSQHAA